ncbi:MAG: hypothetical protein NC043_01185 [Muribaculaceae bacterium]|nr:hypothetical protein [Muribaculaceae bacterium]
MSVRCEINPAYTRYADFIHRLPDIFDSQGSLMYEARNRVKLFTMPDGTKLVVKSYRRPRLIQRMAYTWLRKSKACRAYQYASTLLSMGIRTPEGVAYIEIYSHGLLTDSYFISVFTPLPALRGILEADSPAPELIKATALFIAEMHDKGVIHGDPNLSNILVDTSARPYTFEVIDTNRSRFKKHFTEKEIIANLVRLTHVHKLSDALAREYATATGRDPELTAGAVARGLNRFERSRRIRHALKDAIRIHH